MTSRVCAVEVLNAATQYSNSCISNFFFKSAFNNDTICLCQLLSYRLITQLAPLYRQHATKYGDASHCLPVIMLAFGPLTLRFGLRRVHLPIYVGKM